MIPDGRMGAVLARSRASLACLAVRPCLSVSCYFPISYLCPPYLRVLHEAYLHVFLLRWLQAKRWYVIFNYATNVVSVFYFVSS